MASKDEHVAALKGTVEGMQEVQGSVFRHIVACLNDYLETVPPDQQLDMRRKFLAAFNLQAMFDEARRDHGVRAITVLSAKTNSGNWCKDMAELMCRCCESLGQNNIDNS